ncbi:MAG: hypothetical protein DI551_01635 [Micavibrio aeruginosavorus]|uniref:Flagellar hook-length control protein-like C-terminal domain-containing protein n=1 Tax=Micavibrio aeruginosavorus TaxID=349221 RepID=A0A2W5N7E8_9BACT|nr:MAG: hypothetical protein DI551_01635 [Micavibrio aeruginosavorus]
MSNMNPIASTQIAAGSSTGLTGVATALSGSKTSGVLAGGAGGLASFWDMIISQFGADEGLKTGITNATNVAASADSTLETKTPANGDNPLAMLQIALASQNVDANGNLVIDTTTTPADPTKLQNQLDLTNTIINKLKNMFPDNTGEKDGLLNAVIGKLQTKSDTLQASLSALNGGTISKDTPVEDIPLPMLIALGLNPSEISEVTQKIQDLEKKLGRDITVEDLIAGVGGILPPNPQTAVVAVGTTKDGKAVIDSIDENSAPTDDLAAQLNAMDVGSGDSETMQNTEKSLTNAVKDHADGKAKTNTSDLEQSLDKPAADAKNGTTDGHMKKDAGAFKENLVNMMNGNKAQSGEMVFPATSFATDASASYTTPSGYAASPSLNFGTTAQAANMVSSPTVAGQAHPATQTVAATLTKAAKGGEDSTINLRMDPPELGNVAVRLQFGKDKTVKAHVTVEKPETFMMLQREGHSLERALQAAGLDTQGQSISFELAQDNSAFRQNNGGNGNENFGSGGGNNTQDADGAEEIIQSSVNWQVDPSTGHVRYNLFA